MPFPWLKDDMPKPIPPAEGPCPKLAEMTRELIKGLTLRQAANRTGGKVSHDTIRRATDGQRVTPEKLDILALSFGSNPNELRHAAGHGLLPNYPHPVSGEMVEDSAGVDETNPLIQYTPDGYQITLTSPDGKPVQLQGDSLRRLDLEIRLTNESEQIR